MVESLLNFFEVLLSVFDSGCTRLPSFQYIRVVCILWFLLILLFSVINILVSEVVARCTSDMHFCDD